MAKDLEVDFNARNFIETFPEDSEQPVMVTKEERPKKPPKVKPEMNKSPIEMKASDSPTPKIEGSDVSPSPLSLAEKDYISRFVDRAEFTQVSKKGKQVSVAYDHLKKIRSLISLLGDGTTISMYIDNVLSEHFEEYGTIIQTLLQKEITKH